MKLRLTLEVDPSVLSDLEAQAMKDGVTLETLITRRLTACRTHTSSKPIYITDSDRSRLDALLGMNVSTPRELLEAIDKKLTLSIEGTEVTLTPNLLKRLSDRNTNHLPLSEWTQRVVKEQVERFCEVR